MRCDDCNAAEVTAGRWYTFNPACLWCGARLIRRLGTMPRPASEITARRQQALKDWMANGHSEQALRDLAKSGPAPLAPSSSASPSERRPR